MSDHSEQPTSSQRTGTAGEDELLAFLDGELTAERQAEIRELCETDWETRARLARVQRRIEKYVEATSHHSPIDIPPFDDFWKTLSPTLKDLPSAAVRAVDVSTPGVKTDTEDGSSWLHGLIDRFTRPIVLPSLRLRLTMGLAALLLIGAATTYLFNPIKIGTVSAQELLQLSAQAEIGRSRQVAEPVVYRRLEMRRRSRSGVDSVAWESWDDKTGNRFRLRVADAQGERFLHENESQTPVLLAEFERILAQNRLDSQPPLSAAAYARWREQVRRSAENVTEVSLTESPRETGLKLTTRVEGPHARDSIIEASLIVRRSDWHPIAQSLKVQGEGEVREYDLGELAYGVLPSQALTVNSSPVPVTPVTVATPSVSPSRAAVLTPLPSPLPPLPSAAALMDTETATLYALHRAQADLGEQIEVLREADRQVVVQGLVETDARKQQLTEALDGIPLLAVRIQSVEEVIRQAAKQTQAAEVISVDESTPSAAPGRSAFEQILAQYYLARGESRKSAEQKIVEFSNSAMGESSAMLSQAWALRRLAERFSTERELAPAARQRIDEMLAHHVAGLKERARVLRNRLEPVLVGIADGNAAPIMFTTEHDWPSQALTVFRSVEQVHQLASRLFTSGDGASSTPAQSARQILDGVARLDGALQILARQVLQTK